MRPSAAIWSRRPARGDPWPAENDADWAEYHDGGDRGVGGEADECWFEGLHVYGSGGGWPAVGDIASAGDDVAYEGLHPDIDLLLERDRDHGGDWQALIAALHRAGSATWQWAIRRCRAMQRFEAQEQISLRALLAGLAEPGASDAPHGATAEAAEDRESGGMAHAQAPRPASSLKGEPR
jgi:hypothetical protein